MCSLKKKELLEEVWDYSKLVDPGFVHFDLPSEGIQLQTLWFSSVDLVLGDILSCFGPMVVDFVSRSYSRTFESHI